MYVEQTCVVYLIVRPSVGRGLRLEDVSRGKKMYFEQTCVVDLIVRPSVGRGLGLEDVSRGKKIYLEKTCVVYLIERPFVGRGLRLQDASRAKKMDFANLWWFLNCNAFGGSRVKTRRCISGQEDVF